MPRCLGTRELNALRAALATRTVRPEDVATLDLARLLRLPGLGAKSIANIRAWLAEHGRHLGHDGDGAAAERMARHEELARERMTRRSIAHLKSLGYVVQPPENREAP